MKKKYDYSPLVIEYMARFAGNSNCEVTKYRYTINYELNQFVSSLNWNEINYLISVLKNEKPFLYSVCNMRTNLPLRIIDKHKNVLPWKILGVAHRKTKKFVNRFHNYINWTQLAAEGIFLNENEFDNCKEYLDWTTYCCYNGIDDKFLNRYKDKIDWRVICKDSIVPEEWMTKFHDCVIWSLCVPSLTDDFIKKNHSIINWDDISLRGEIDEKFYNKNKKFLNLELLKQNESIEFELI